MRFRLSRAVSGKRVTFAFSGELTAEAVPEVAGAVERERSGSIVFDLADLTIASREGIDYLRHAAAGGAALVNCPPYIGRWIEATEADGSPPGGSALGSPRHTTGEASHGNADTDTNRA